jgi:hypothetical protein
MLGPSRRLGGKAFIKGWRDLARWALFFFLFSSGRSRSWRGWLLPQTYGGVTQTVECTVATSNETERL